MRCETPGQDGQPRTGTRRGYLAHKRAGEDPCRECRQAANRHRTEQRLARYHSDPEYRERERQRRRKYRDRRRST